MIKAENLTKLFEKKAALNNISCEISEGSIYGLVGSNGSGKSTLLRLIAGVYKADSGVLTVDGDITFNNPIAKSKVAFLGDTPYFLRQASFADMAKFYASLYPTFDDKIYRELIDAFPVDYKSKISTMSKGMQRQAALILAVSTSPKYLLLDEAFDGLDVVMRKVLKNILIDSVEKRGMTTVIASHNLRELEELCDHVGLIHNGNILLNNEIDNIKSNTHKLQMAFSHIPELTAFGGLDIIKSERSGSILQLIVRGDEDEILKYVKNFSPIFAECIEPNLEEVFIYELGARGYDVKDIIE